MRNILNTAVAVIVDPVKTQAPGPMTSRADPQPRILVIDDNPSIVDHFRRILAQNGRAAAVELGAPEEALFAVPMSNQAPRGTFELDTASQGQEGLNRLVAACSDGRPYAVAFVGMRMPPGWDGPETIERLWQVDPALQIVLCAAHSDPSWEELRARLGERDGLLVIKKPFDPIEVVQCARALTSKWRLARAAEAHLHLLEAAVRDRTAELNAANQQLLAEMRERGRVESDLRLAQKLEAIGQLAAGVAHEINTPLQFVGDSLCFVRDSLKDMFAMIRDLRTASDRPELTARFDQLADTIELPYLDEHVPLAIRRIEDGIGRIAGVVQSMKEFAHAGPRDLLPVDVNRALTNTLRVTANNYEYVADLEVELVPLPSVLGHADDLELVFTNLIVNAAHALEDRVAAGRGRGRLKVSTRLDRTDVVVSIADDGVGIPVAIQDRIFDAFYTTKEVGRGTGQGLGISRRIVVQIHGGALTYDTAVGIGTTFYVRLPIERSGRLKREQR